jgi:hypothetical protein
MNLGPHALYIGGAAHRAFKDWNIPFTGAIPDLRGRAVMAHGNEKYPFFVNLPGMLRSALFNLREKLELMRILRLATTPQQPAERSMEDWIIRRTSSPRVADFVHALTRVSTYCGDPQHLSAARALDQIRSAFTRRVLYLDGGWQTLVNGLAERARQRGVEIRNRAQIESLSQLDTGGVVLAISPAAIERISGAKLPKLRPSRMACLQIGLRRMPEGAVHFMLGMDQPIYFSVHSTWAKLASGGRVVVHVGKYLKGDDNDDIADRKELEAFTDRAMPGWRDHADVVQFLPTMIVTHGMAACEGRPDVDALGLDGIAIAGDWVGDEGMLVDSSVASALRAASRIQNRKAHAA